MGLFLRHSGKTEDEVFNHLTRWNAEKLGGYLKTSELKKITRNVFKDRYIRPPSCKHPAMRVNCVGPDCYSIKSGKLWEHAPVTPSGAMACSLLPFIPAKEWKG